MKRVIEITAKSQEEAVEMAKRELAPGERIAESTILSAPAKGIFGIVGNPEYRIRFSIESTSTEVDSELVEDTSNDYDSCYENDFSEEDEEEDDDDIDEVAEDVKEHKNEQKNGKSSSTTKYSTEFAGERHPAYTEICNLIKEVAYNVGVSEIKLTEKLENNTWIFDAAGENISQLIGKHGKTLDALQYLVNIIANKDLESKVKIVLDVQGYRDQRYKGLIRLANRMYRKVIDSGKQVELEPMSTIDRRTIHLALRNKTDVETFSRGVEPLRRVVIAPKRTKNKGNWKTPKSFATQSKTTKPSVSKSVPMFMEEDGSDQE